MTDRRLNWVGGRGGVVPASSIALSVFKEAVAGFGDEKPVIISRFNPFACKGEYLKRSPAQRRHYIILGIRGSELEIT